MRSVNSKVCCRAGTLVWLVVGFIGCASPIRADDTGAPLKPEVLEAVRGVERTIAERGRSTVDALKNVLAPPAPLPVPAPSPEKDLAPPKAGAAASAGYADAVEKLRRLAERLPELESKYSELVSRSLTTLEEMVSELEKQEAARKKAIPAATQPTPATVEGTTLATSALVPFASAEWVATASIPPARPRVDAVRSILKLIRRGLDCLEASLDARFPRKEL